MKLIINDSIQEALHSLNIIDGLLHQFTNKGKIMNEIIDIQLKIMFFKDELKKDKNCLTSKYMLDLYRAKLILIKE